MEVIPSPGTEEKDWTAMEKRLSLVSPFAKTIHIDICDGIFAPNTTFLDPEPFKKFTKDIFFEVHLMVDNPLQYLKPFADAGFRRFIGHVEKMPDQVEFVAQGQLLGEVGLAIDGKSPISSVKVPFEDLDCILVMAINGGFSGQAFTEEHMDKVKALYEKTFIPIEVDGGINDSTIVKAKEAGTTRFVSTSFIFGAEDPKAAYELLQEKVQS